MTGKYDNSESIWNEIEVHNKENEDDDNDDERKLGKHERK